MIALFAALIVPWFVNWNDYRGAFEAEASRILGHRVHVEGNAHATILPSPSLTFTNVAVDDQDGQRIMNVARFDVVIELMPLLQGKIRVVSMTLDKPVVNVAVDAAGGIPWLKRAKLNEPFNPDNVILDNISIRDGTLNYANKRMGVALAFDGISAQVSATALLGPWHVDGFYRDNGNQVGFRISTGRVLDDGTLRVKADVNPARWPVTVSADGPVGIDPTGDLTWHGTYSVSEVSSGDSGAGNGDSAAGSAANGWRSEGAFTLTSDKLDISKAVLSNGPVDRPLSVAGTLAINFGRTPSFAATAEARQIDLDRTLGKGPAQPVQVATAADSLLAWLGQIPVPDEPGSIRLDVPAIVVGGRIIEDVSFAVAPAESGWQIGSLKAKLPGQATLEVSGLMTTQQKLGFVGQAHLAVDQPATFATWWRGKSQEGGGRLLAPFDLSGHVDVAPGRLSVEQVAARIADANITGSFGWTEQPKDHYRDLYADLDATRVDYVQVKALAELLVGHNLNDAGSIADGYSLHVKAGAFVFSDLTVKGIEINTKYRDDALIVTMLRIDDLGGARIERTSGKIEALSGDPRGHLVTTLDAPQLTGLARLADRFLPGSGLTRWLDAAAPALGEAVIRDVEISAPLPDGTNGFAFTIDNGVAASTTFNVSAKFTGGFAHWRTKPADIKATLDSPDSAGLARQFGLAAVALKTDNGAHLEVQSTGTPADGLDTVVVGDLAGLVVNLSGKTTIAEDLSSSFSGKIGANADNLDPLMAMAGLDIPGAPTGTALALDGQLAVSRAGLEIAWKNGKIGPAVTGGDVTLATDGNGGWHVGGNVATDDIDLGWIASLGLGFAPVPTGDPVQPWSHLPFSAPGFGPVSGALQVKAGRLDVGTLGVTGTAFTLALQPQRVDVNLTAGQIAAGTVTGGMSINNVGGNVTLAGRFDLKGAALESFVWKREGRSVAMGTLDLSANFESTGTSPAGLVSTMTGGGVVTVHDGLARYVNPNTVRLLVRASDLGQQFSEDALRAAFSERIDADNLPFKDASGAFAIVAGAVRLKNLIVKSEGVTATGNAVVDFNAMTLNSDWSLAFAPVDDKVKGADPTAGIVFNGPIAAPTRTVDVLPFAAYLNEREAARMTEIIALDAATREEKQRLTRLADKLKTDAAQRAEDARIAAEKEAERRAVAAAEAARLEAFHENREILVEQRHVKALAALADRLAAQQAEAEAKSAEAGQAAKAARTTADAAEKALANARAVGQEASTKADAASAALAKAKAEADAAAQNASQLSAAADQADQALSAAANGESEAKAAADAAGKAKTAADRELKAATVKAATASKAADTAAAKAAVAVATRNAAAKAADDAVKVRDAASAELAKAETAVKNAQTLADAATAKANDLAGKDSDAEAAKAKADADAKAAAEALASATNARGTAAANLVAAKQAAAKAQNAADLAQSQAKQSADFATTLTDGAGTDAAAIAAAQAQQTAADLLAKQAATKKAAADAAAATLTSAQAAFDRAATALDGATKQLAAANAAAAQADAAAKTAAASAGDAANERDAALSQLDTATKARDAAKAAFDQKTAAVAKTADELTAATKTLAGANGAADKAASEVKSAQAAKANAEQVATESAAKANETAKAAQAATTKWTAADADARAAATKVATARKALAAAEKTFEAKASANDDARAALQSAVADRQQAETAAGTAETQARAAEAAAKSATAEASTAATAADAARQTADQAAAAAPDPGTIAITTPPVLDAGAAAAASPPNTGASSVPAVPKAAVPAPRPNPRIVPPVPTTPGNNPLNGPLVITPPY